jgi:hypothetical protein
MKWELYISNHNTSETKGGKWKVVWHSNYTTITWHPHKAPTCYLCIVTYFPKSLKCVYCYKIFQTPRKYIKISVHPLTRFSFLSFFLKINYREEGRRRDRNINNERELLIGCPLGIQPATRACALGQNRTWDPSVHNALSTKPNQLGLDFLFLNIFFFLEKKRGRKTSVWECNIYGLPPARARAHTPTTTTRDQAQNSGMCLDRESNQ